jgi:hypothetical protein
MATRNQCDVCARFRLRLLGNGEGEPHFQEARAPSRAELEDFLDKIDLQCN